jgi:hypothetical protein
MKVLFFGFSWFLLSTGVILTSIAALHFFKLQQTEQLLANANNEGLVLAAAQDLEVGEMTSNNQLETILESADARAQLVANFLARHNSPLEPHDDYGALFVEIADRYDIDFRLLPAIAMQESNLCKVIPENSYNCLGFGVHSRGTLRFESYEANFERAARELKANYIDQGLTTPEEIMRKYTPSSKGSWAASVNQWMAEMRFDDRSLGRSLKENADLLEFTSASSP